MRVKLLGTAAGGGFPQWNCNCDNCDGVRRGSIPAVPRTQSSIAVSVDGRRWVLLNASPDVGAQIAAFPALWPADGTRRDSPIAAVLLTNADLDHTLGLFQLREGGPLVVYASESTRESLERGLRMSAVLDRYCGIEWRTPPIDEEPLRLVDGSTSGLSFRCEALPSGAPKYMRGAQESADSLVYYIRDEVTGGRLVFVPDLAAVDDALIDRWRESDLILIDGTFWSEDEMRTAGVGTALARHMGHVPIGGVDGSLARLAELPHVRRIYVHINNTNPMLRDDSPERAAVKAIGVEVGVDGMEIEI